MATDYKGRNWADWQARFNEMHEAGKATIFKWASFAGTTDAQAILRKVADIHTGAISFEGIEKQADTAFNSKFETFYTDFKTYFHGQPYDESVWSKEKIKEAYQQRWELEGYDPGAVATVGDVVKEQIYNDMQDKVKAGTHDAETGKPFTAGEAGAWTKQADDLFSGSGLNKADHPELFNKLEDMLKKKEMDPYEAKQWFEGSKEFVEQEYKRQYAEYAPKIDEATKRRLAILDEEGARTAKQLGIEFEKITPELAATAKQYGGMTREDTFISDTLTKYKADMEQERGSYMEMLRLKEKMVGEQQKSALEAGEFDTLKGITDDSKLNALQSYQRVLNEQTKTREQMANLSMEKSAVLAQRATDRYNREQEKFRKKQERDAKDATEKAYKKARKLGAWVQPVIGAIAGMAGGPVGMAAGAATAYGMNRLQSQGIDAPSVVSTYKQGKQVGVGAQSYYNQYQNWYGDRYKNWSTGSGYSANQDLNIRSPFDIR